MSSAAQILANQANATLSTGPVTPEGKSRVSQNARKLGLFTIAGFIRPEEREIFDEFTDGYIAELSPATPLEQTLAREIIHAAWRLRRCADVESRPPEHMTDEELDRLQASVDRARTTASRSLHRALAEFRRSKQLDRRLVPVSGLEERHRPAAAPAIPVAKQSQSQVPAHPVGPAEQNQFESGPSASALPPAPSVEAAKQSQSQPQAPRNAPCPCGSRNKYKRCCGTSAQAATRAAVVRV